MNKVIIDKSFFDLDNPLSAGLVTGLRKLVRKNFLLESEGFDSVQDKSLSRILNLEGISINPPADTTTGKTFYITAKPSENLNSIQVPSEGIKTFEDAVNTVVNRLRFSIQHRATKETDIKIEVSLDGSGKSSINTGIGFFDHMLEQIARHGNINLIINVNGDLHVDEHHTVEDVGITLGQAIAEALGDKAGIKRYGFSLPMDDAIAHCALDLGGRGFLNFKCKFEREKVGEFPTELTEEFFRGMASGLKANIFIRVKAKNDHHKIESIFKAFAKSLNEACRMDERNEGNLPSTKGIL
jgi:imidazoleglycerol-phosphate dehydratase/histidinol-phosphatase